MTNKQAEIIVDVRGSIIKLSLPQDGKDPTYFDAFMVSPHAGVSLVKATSRVIEHEKMRKDLITVYAFDLPPRTEKHYLAIDEQRRDRMKYFTLRLPNEKVVAVSEKVGDFIAKRLRAYSV